MYVIFNDKLQYNLTAINIAVSSCDLRESPAIRYNIRGVNSKTNSKPVIDVKWTMKKINIFPFKEPGN